MAYNKKYAELGESVIDYVNEREDAIEAGFDDSQKIESEKNLTLRAGWTGTAKYYKDRDRVYVYGNITGGTDRVFGYLPEGYLPKEQMFFYGVTSNGNAIQVNPNGYMSHVGGTIGEFTIFSFSFRQ